MKSILIIGLFILCALGFRDECKKIAAITLVLLAISSLGYSQIGIKGDLSVTTEAEPGDTISLRFFVANFGKQIAPIDIRILDHDGSRIYRKRGAVKRSLASWVQLNAQALEIRPGDEFPLICRIRIPNDPDLSGSYFALISIMETGGSSGSSRKMAVGVKRSLSALVRVDIKGTQLSDITILEQQIEEGILSLRVKNSGNVILAPTFSLEITDGETLRADRSRKLYPDQIATIRIPLAGVLPGRQIRGLLIIDAGDENIWISRISFGVRGGGPTAAF